MGGIKDEVVNFVYNCEKGFCIRGYESFKRRVL